MSPYRLFDDTYFNRHDVVAVRQSPSDTSLTYIWLRGISEQFGVRKDIQDVLFELTMADKDYS